eukprot:1619170-Pleurochrysis_carterae.AAC.3
MHVLKIPVLHAQAHAQNARMTAQKMFRHVSAQVLRHAQIVSCQFTEGTQSSRITRTRPL